MIIEQDLLFEEHPVPLFYIENNSTIVEVNQAFSSRYIQSSAIVGRALEDFIHPIPSDLFQSGQDTEYQCLSLPDGNSLLVQLHIRDLPQQDKNIQLVAVKELFPSFQSNADMQHPLLEAMFDKAFDLILITNDEGRIIHVNDTACYKLGYTRSQLLAMPVAKITYRPMQSYQSYKWDEFMEPGIDEGTYVLQNRRGEILYTEYKAITNIRPGQHLSILRDVTHQKKLEEREWFKSKVIKSSADGILFLEPDNRIRYANTSWLKMWGYKTEEEVIGRNITDFLEQQPSRLALFDRKLQQEGSYCGQLTAIRRDGTTFKAMVSARIGSGSPGVPSYRTASFKNISDHLELKNNLKSSRHRYRKLLDSIPDAVLVANNQGKITYSNSETSAMFGYSRDELTGQPVEEIIPKAYQLLDGKDVGNYFEHPEKRSIGSGLEVYAIRKDETKFPVYVMLGPMQDRDETRVLAVIRDISKFQLARDKLEREKSFTDLLHRLTKISNEAKSINEALQKNIEEICTFMNWPFGRAYLPAGDSANTFKSAGIWYKKHSRSHISSVDIDQQISFSPGEGMIGKVIETGQPTWRVNMERDETITANQKKNDFSIQTTFAFPILVEQEVVGVLEFFSPSVISSDTFLLKKMSVIGTQLGRVIERDRRQRLIRHNLELFSQLFENSPVGVVMLDESGRVKDINPSFKKMFGYTLNEIKNKRKSDFLTPRSRNKEIKATPQYASKAPFQFESIRVNKKGEEIPVLVGIVPVRVEGKSIAEFVLYVDITERKQAEQRLQESLEEKEVLLAEIHHRVKNNLAVIMGLLELQKENTPDDRSYRSLQDSQSRIHSMALVHEQLYQTEFFSSVQVDKYIERLANTIRSTFSDPETEIELDIKADSIKLTMNQAVPLGLLLNEILTNAFKHAFLEQSKGRVTITACRVDELVELKVEDNGQGLPEDFDVESANSLGMTLIQVLSTQLEADLTIDGGEGTTFTVQFTRDLPSQDAETEGLRDEETE